MTVYLICYTFTMHRKKLHSLLQNYTPFDDHEKKMVQDVITFVESTPDCFENTHAHGHITASAWIVDAERKHTGLVHHVKLNKWMQPGGHSDGKSDTAQESLREAIEEFGNIGLKLVHENIFDVDIHAIPEDKKRGLGKHLHYDIRFLIEGDSSKDPILSDESHEAAWIPLDKVHTYNNEDSVMRMVRKLQS